MVKVIARNFGTSVILSISYLEFIVCNCLCAIWFVIFFSFMSRFVTMSVCSYVCKKQMCLQTLRDVTRAIDHSFVQ